MMDTVEIGEIGKEDFRRIAEINEMVVEHMSPMDEARLEELLGYTGYARKITAGGDIAGFILAMPENRPYRNDNYGWFSARYGNFLYIDRIAIMPGYEGRGLGSALYRDLFEFAQRAGKEVIACEINVVPPNEQSMMFHRKFGFSEAGQQWLGNGAKKVSMQIRKL